MSCVDEDISDSYKQGLECWISGNHENHEHDENHWNPVCKPRLLQTTDLEVPDNSFRFPLGADNQGEKRYPKELVRRQRYCRTFG